MSDRREGIPDLLVQAGVTGREKSILDVGCGTGLWSLAVARMCPEAKIVGFDPYEPDLAQAREQAAADGLPVECHLLDFDQGMEHLKGRSFDLIMCNGVMHYLDRPRAFKCLSELLADDGWLMVYHTHCAGYYLQRTLQNLAAGKLRTAFYYSRPLRWTHPRNLITGRHDGETCLSPKRLARYGRQAGLSMEILPPTPEYPRSFLGLRVVVSARFHKEARTAG